MFTLTDSSATTEFATSLVIDFSDKQYTDKHPLLLESEMQRLLSFIRSHPQRGNIHIYVRSGIVSATNRKLQSQLQSLGCKVTTKVSL